jgi:hypothetical protein
MQVVTNENMQQLIETRKVDEYKPPESKTETKTEEVKPEVKDEKPRGEDGKFVKADESSVTTDKEAAKTAEDDEDADLPERVRKQIGKKHRAMKEAEETARQWWEQKTAAEQRAEKAERELQALKSGSEKSKGAGEPDPKDFKTNAEYIDAMVEYRFEKKERAEAQKRYEASQQKAQAEFVDRLNIARKEIPDYDEVVGDADIEVVAHVASYIAESESGPNLGYYFAKNPDELERIQKLSPIRAIAELGKLETRLEKPDTKADVKADAKVEAKEPKLSKAPSPIAPVDTASKTVVTKDPAKMTFQELREYERARERERARR